MLAVRFNPRNAFVGLVALFFVSIVLLYPHDYSRDVVAVSVPTANPTEEVTTTMAILESPTPIEPTEPVEPVEPVDPPQPPEPEIRYEGGSLGGPPPSHDAVQEYERTLPQHNLDLPYPEGQTGRYVRFNIQPHGQGWNNILNEWIIHTQIAHDSGRAYVFEDYVWATPHYPCERVLVPEGADSAPRPTTPINSLLSGPTAGGPWDPSDTAPRSVHVNYWEKACPESERLLLNGKVVRDAVRGNDSATIFNHYVHTLTATPERCVEITDGGDLWSAQVFGFYAISTERSLPLQMMFLDKAASRLLAPSPLVASAVARNQYMFVPRPQDSTQLAPRDPFARMLAVHVRRGDFGWACRDRATNADTYYGWMLWPTIIDRDEKPPGGGLRENTTQEAMDIYMKHCYPDSEQLRTRIAEMRRQYVANTVPRPDGTRRTLDVLYLLTNGDKDWLRTLSDELVQDGWGTVVTSRELKLDDEQLEVSMAVDMEIARKAEVFAGNAWSSFSSNVMHTRIRDGRESLANRVL